MVSHFEIRPFDNLIALALCILTRTTFDLATRTIFYHQKKNTLTCKPFTILFITGGKYTYNS